MDDDQQFCLRWNNHQSTLISVFDTLLEKGIHVDCTLAAEGQTLRAHKVVLSACSPYFENVLSQQYDKHPIIILKDVKYAELRAMMDYMYRGEVNISQDQLAALLKAAESLQIKGLSDNKPARPPPAPTTRNASPVTKLRDGSADSREGSVSPTRRRKKARRASTDGLTPTTNNLVLPAAPIIAPVSVSGSTTPAPSADDPVAGEPADCKLEEGSRGAEGEGVEDLTLDEENEEPPVTGHNDVVRNFQWHMERSQEEMMNADGTRDSQGHTARSKSDNMIKIKKVQPEIASTFAVLRNVVIPNEDVIEPLPEEMIDIKSPIDLSTDPLSLGSSPQLKKEDKRFPKEPFKCVSGVAVSPDAQMKKDKTMPEANSPQNMKKGGKEKHVTLPVVGKVNTSGKNEIIDAGEKTDKVLRRGRPPKREKQLKDNEKDKKGKGLKKYMEDKEKPNIKGDTENINKKEPKKEIVDEYEFPSEPLPCSQYKTDKGYKCPNCPRCYNARKNLVRHVTLECGRDPQYQCPHCPYSKHRRNELKKHIQKKHANEPDKPIKRRV